MLKYSLSCSVVLPSAPECLRKFDLVSSVPRLSDLKGCLMRDLVEIEAGASNKPRPPLSDVEELPYVIVPVNCKVVVSQSLVFFRSPIANVLVAEEVV